jgi:S-adenosylmethionine synthetase
MDYLRVSNDFFDPAKKNLEIVERKGLGHPDTLADALAELVSIDYSNFCLDNFGAVLHHNIDKFYIGAGLFKSDFGYCEKIKPVQIFINGRMSNSFGGQKIDLVGMQRETILNYLRAILPRLSESDIVINHNATQNSRLSHWFSPRDINDLPEYSKLSAGDSAVCIFSWPLSPVENLVYRLEEFFWDKVGDFPHPKFDNIGQDIKVMAFRQGNKVDVGIRLPIISTSVGGKEEYETAVDLIQQQTRVFAHEIVDEKLNLSLRVNTNKPYLLGIGSCIECGEEGLVGRGNSNSGLISVFRPHSVEAPSGKNPVYHTGRVLNFLVMNLSKALYNELGVKNTVSAVTKNGGSLVPPTFLSISTDKKISRIDLEGVVKKYFLEVDYLSRLLSERQIK